MSLLLSAIITSIRDRHAAFHRKRVTDAVLARFLSSYQNTLIGKCVKREKMFLRQSVGFAIAINNANDPGTVGAGTSGGLPGSVDDDGNVSVVQESAGALIEPLLETADAGQIVVAERVVTSVVGQVITSTGAGRTVNQDLDRLIHITAGKGRGQVRVVASNTADSWTPDEDWDTVPDTTSLFTIVEALLTSDEDIGVVTELPAQTARTGYLVRLNAQGVPYIDYGEPLTIWLDRGVPLPEMLAPLGGTVRYTDGEHDELTITTFGRRFEPTRTPAIYLAGSEAFLCGDEEDWQDVESIELVYTPVGPRFTATSEYFLLPDPAEPVLVARGAEFAAKRVNGSDPNLAIDVATFIQDAIEAESDYLETLRLGKRGRRTTFREGRY